MALVKNADKWLLFEDESVELVSEGVVQSVFGSSQVRRVRVLDLCEGIGAVVQSVFGSYQLRWRRRVFSP